MDRAPLHRMVSEAALASIGSPEHIQVGALVRDALKVSFDREAAEAARETLLRRTWTVECNLDLVPALPAPVWLEWPLPTVAGHGGGGDAVTGCLLAPHPADPDSFAVVTGWFDGREVGYSLGVAMVDTREVAVMAYEARHSGERGSAACLERILDRVHASVPPAFAEEIETMTDATADIASIFRDATAEVPLAMTLLLATSARGGIVTAGEAASLGPALSPGPVRRMLDRLSGRPSAGFVRRDRRGGPAVDWIRELPPASAAPDGEQRDGGRVAGGDPGDLGAAEQVVEAVAAERA